MWFDCLTALQTCESSPVKFSAIDTLPANCQSYNHLVYIKVKSNKSMQTCAQQFNFPSPDFVVNPHLLAIFIIKILLQNKFILILGHIYHRLGKNVAIPN